MGGHGTVPDARPAGLGRDADAAVLIALAIGAGLALAQIHAEKLSGLTPVLAVSSVVAGAVVVRSGRVSVTPAFVVVLLAAAFLGPASAFLAAIPAELIVARRMRTNHWLTL